MISVLSVLLMLAAILTPVALSTAALINSR